MEIVMVGQSTENMERVRGLLKQKQPGFAAALELAVDLLERELSSPVMGTFACLERVLGAHFAACGAPCVHRRAIALPARPVVARPTG
jgi:hypothetical protein